jgi:hypothetical protein
MPYKDKARKKPADAAYRAAHREELRVKQAVYSAAHREEQKAYSATYRAKYPEVIAKNNAKQFAKFKRSLTLRIECLRHTSPAFREARIQEIWNWAGTSHSYWVESEMQHVLTEQEEAHERE